MTSSSVVDGYVESDRSFQHAIELLENGSERGFIRFVDLLDTYKIVDAADNTLLHWAAAYGGCKTVEYLLSLGLSVNARNASQATPLLCAAASCPNPGAMIVSLALRGADLRAANVSGDTAASLLVARHMPDVAAMCDALAQSLSAHEECYATAPAPPLVALPGTARAKLMPHLGTSRLLPPSSPGLDVSSPNSRRPLSVSFRPNVASGRPPSGLSSGRLRSSEYPPAASSARRVWSGEEQPLNSLNSISAGVLSDTSGTKSGFCCDAAWWLADSERALLLAQEEQRRERIGVDYYEEYITILYRFFGIESAQEDVVDNIVAVLGEKFGADARRMLLVRWWVDDEAESDEEGGMPGDEAAVHEGSTSEKANADKAAAGKTGANKVFIEDWVPLDEIATAQKVREYVSRFDHTYSTVFSATSDRFAGFHGPDDSRDAEFALDDEEREELERQLGMIPSRRLSSGTSSPSRTSLVLSQDAGFSGGATPPRRGQSGRTGSGRRKGSSDPAFVAHMSAGERAARLYQSERSRHDDSALLIDDGEDYAVNASPFVEAPHLPPAPTLFSVGDTGRATMSSQPPAVQTTGTQAGEASARPLVFDDDTVSPGGTGDGHGVHDTADTSQHSFHSGMTLPPPMSDSTASTTTDAAASPKGSLNRRVHGTQPSELPALPVPPPVPVQKPTRIDVAAAAADASPAVPASRRSPAVRQSITESESPSQEKRASNAAPTQQRLTDSQKSAYDQFLFAAALRMLKK